MNENRPTAIFFMPKKMRNYIAQEFKLNDWEGIAFYFNELLEREIQSFEEYEKWLKDRSELDAVLEEEMAWSYIKMTINTLDEIAVKRYEYLVAEIQPKVAPLEEQLNQKTLAYSEYVTQLSESDEAYFIYFRSLKTAIELFKEENIELETKTQQLAQHYSSIIGKQTISYKEQEFTMPQAAKLLKENDEDVRQTVWQLISSRRMQDAEELESIFTELVELRHKIAVNAGFENYRDYKFKALGRFDYTIQDCFDFHEAIEKEIVPIVKNLQQIHAKKLNKTLLKPWDLEVDADGFEPLKPFVDGAELIDKTISLFTKLDPYFGECLSEMKDKSYLDLDSKPGKAPGGYNYPLYESNIPFIFMNAAGTQRDVVTMVHEGGHAIHSFISGDLPLTGFKSLPSEVAELASMSMELISMDYWDEFYGSKEDLKRAKKEQLEGIIKVLPWIAMVDAFQHWIYTNPKHSVEERKNYWKDLNKRFGTGLVDYSGFEEVALSSWHKQLHLFEVPFYYIEYGIAQLGAIGMWKLYKENAKQGLEYYKNALRLGYTKTIPSIYKTGGLQFNFELKYVSELTQFVKYELENIG